MDQKFDRERTQPGSFGGVGVWGKLGEKTCANSPEEGVSVYKEKDK